MIQYSSVFVYISSILLFLFFKDIKLENSKLSKVINYIASLTFAVYLVHNNDLIIADLWKTLNPAKYENSRFLFVYMSACVFGIFISCCILEILRSKFSFFLHKTFKLEAKCQSVQKRLTTAFDNIIKGEEIP